MSLAYVRKHYQMPWLKRGLRVIVDGKFGYVTSATMHVNVRFDGTNFSVPCHPHDVKRVGQN